MTQNRNKASAEAGTPWWRHGIMWLVVGGPATVVVAGIVTAVIAVNGADIVIDDNAPSRNGADAPAVKARNHAATPTGK
jgi:hypothetical protein